MERRKAYLGLLILAGWVFVAASARSVSPQFPTRKFGPALYADSTQTDPKTGLAIDDQFELVKSQCTACHSSKLIVQSHFTREKWIERIRWMQRTQNLWDLGDQEPAILTYLVKHYGPLHQPYDGRRQPLKPVNWRTDSPSANPAN